MEKVPTMDWSLDPVPSEAGGNLSTLEGFVGSCCLPYQYRGSQTHKPYSLGEEMSESPKSSVSDFIRAKLPDLL